VAGYCRYGDEPSGSGATELVCYLGLGVIPQILQMYVGLTTNSFIDIRTNLTILFNSQV
jgi:hypothetical protein